MTTTPGNATNTKTTGIVGFTGTAMTGSPATQYTVQVGGATSSTLASVGPGSTGQVLQSGGNAANPAYSTATYPSTAGTSGNVLTSDGTNWVSQAPAAVSNAFNQIVIQVFTSTGANTYTPTTGMKYCIVEVVGAGGGGGGVTMANSSQACGAGGGAGAYGRGVFTAATVGASQTVTIGTGGTAGANTGGTGGTGGTSSFGTLISCTGGTGGAGQATGTTGGATLGGTGGTASGTGLSFGVTGGQGHQGLWCNNGGGVGNLLISKGRGADSLLGTGGTYSVAQGTASSAGSAGSQGGGGSGGLVSGNPASQTGGAGGNGFCVITQYLSV